MSEKAADCVCFFNLHFPVQFFMYLSATLYLYNYYFLSTTFIQQLLWRGKWLLNIKLLNNTKQFRTSKKIPK